MTSLVSPLTRISRAGVSDADFTALESSVTTNSSKYSVSQVDGLVAARTTPTDVQTLMSTRFLAQDTQNFLTYQDRASSLTAATAAATYAPQSTTYAKTEVDTIASNITTVAA